jgi:hypothetical protein
MVVSYADRGHKIQLMPTGDDPAINSILQQILSSGQVSVSLLKQDTFVTEAGEPKLQN